jgi:hypothetical protein
MNYSQATGKSIQEAFDAYHAANPHVYVYFKKLALKAIKLGKKKVSFKLIMNVIRWEIYLKTHDPTEVRLPDTQQKTFKINDAYGSRYARLFVRDYPSLKDYIELRELRS